MRTTHRSLHVFVLRNAPGGVSMKGGNQSIYYTDLYLVFAAYFPVCDNHNEFLQYIKYDNCTPKNIGCKCFVYSLIIIRESNMINEIVICGTKYDRGYKRRRKRRYLQKKRREGSHSLYCMTAPTAFLVKSSVLR